MTCQYIRIMAKIIRPHRAKKSRIQARPKKSAKKSRAAPLQVAKRPKAPGLKAPKPKASKPKASKPWTEAEVREAFSRFRKANPEPKGELEHLNP
jgi:endonuclease III